LSIVDWGNKWLNQTTWLTIDASSLESNEDMITRKIAKMGCWKFPLLDTIRTFILQPAEGQCFYSCCSGAASLTFYLTNRHNRGFTHLIKWETSHDTYTYRPNILAITQLFYALK